MALNSLQRKNGLVFGKFAPFHNGHEMLIREALKSCDGDVYVLAYDHPGLCDIPTPEMIEMMGIIINDERCHIIPCYDSPAPGKTQELRDAHNVYMQSKIPLGIKVDRVFNNEWYGADVANYLDAELIRVDPERRQYPISATKIRAQPELYMDHLNPLVAQRLNKILSAKAAKKPLFSEIIDSAFLELEIDGEAIKSKAANLNPGYDSQKLNSVMRWDVSQFAHPHLPAIIGELRNKADYSNQRGLRVLDMALRMPDQGWAIPKEFAQFSEAIALAVEHERSINPDFDEHYFVYITIDQKKVLPGKSQRRAGYHSDAYVTNETTVKDQEEAPTADNTYVVADKLPTLYQVGPFPLDGIDPEDCEAVLNYFDAASVGKEPVTFPAHTLLKMTPYDIHTPQVNTTSETIERTFIKIQFSKERYNLIGNTVNPNLSYEGWEWIPRNPKMRNHRNSIVGWDRADKEQFTQVYPYSVDFSQEKPDVSWAEDHFIWAQKVEPVRAEPASVGEMLYTKHGDDLITVNIAQEGDMKITTSRGDQYFLTAEKFKKRYKPEAIEGGLYEPMGTPQKVLITKQPVMLRASWGAMQYAPAGSALTTVDAAGSIYAIHKTNFEASYKVIEPSKDTPDPRLRYFGQTSVCSVCGKCANPSASRGC